MLSCTTMVVLIWDSAGQAHRARAAAHACFGSNRLRLAAANCPFWQDFILIFCAIVTLAMVFVFLQSVSSLHGEAPG